MFGRTHLINLLIQKNGYKHYLEIGVHNGYNFNNVLAEDKVGVDPHPLVDATFKMTSDEFFKLNNKKFDIIFIDGLHKKYQVLKDVINSLMVLNDSGIIIMDDCNPENISQASLECKDCEGDYFVWLGSVWEAWIHLRATDINIKQALVDFERGLGLITKGSQELISFDFKANYEDKFNIWKKNSKELSNIITFDQFLKDYIYA